MTTSSPNQTPRRLLGVWAHPDDEAYLAAALMAETIADGGSVTLIAITDGELGFPDTDLRSRPERAHQRRAELTNAMAAIGVHDIRFLGVADGAVKDAPVTDLAREIRAIIEDVSPDVITTFGPEGITGHEDHIGCGRATTIAWLQAEIGDLWYAAKTTSWLSEWRTMHDELGIWMTEEPVGVDERDMTLVLMLDDKQVDQKRRVLAAHASQTTGLAYAIGETDYLRWIRQECFRRPTSEEIKSARPQFAMTR